MPAFQMKPIRFQKPSRVLLAAMAAVALLHTGCESLEDAFSPAVQGPFYTPANVILTGRKLPANVRRVAVLPMTTALGNQAAKNGAETIEPLLLDELAKARLFEVVRITPERLMALAGKPALRADDRLPPDLLERLSEETACHAFLFTELTVYRAYPPLAIGWKISLFSLSDGQLLWSLDEQFDAGMPSVANGARRHLLHHQATASAMLRETPILNSPASFARYTISAATETMRPLPALPKKSKEIPKEAPKPAEKPNR